MAADRDTQVIISGGGPVGMGLAIELGQRGVRVLVLEKHPSPQWIPKGQNLTSRTMEHFQAWGAEARLRAARPVPGSFGIGGLTAYGTLLGDHHYDWLKRELVRPFYAADNERLPQYETEAVLNARAAEIDAIERQTPIEVICATQDNDGVAVTVRDREKGETVTLTADYAVGCDGARSTLRRAAGLTQTVRDHDRLMVLLVFQSDVLHRALLETHPGKSFFNVLHPDLEGYWLFFGRVDLEGEFFFHAPLPAGADRDAFDFKAYVERAVGAEIDMELRHRGFWDCRVAIADRYGAGRIFVAGDAAHNHPPYGGYGINTGFEDARNLGWKLAARLQGWGGDALLASYDAERRPVFRSTAEDFIEASIATDRDFLVAHDPERDRAAFEAAWEARASGASSEVGTFQPNYRGSPIVAGARDGAADARAAHVFLARPGFHLAPRALPDGTDVFRELGADFTLVALDRMEAARAFARAARAMSVPLKIIEAAGVGELRDYEAPMILVRPDHFVAWCGDATDGPEGNLRLAVGRC